VVLLDDGANPESETSMDSDHPTYEYIGAKLSFFSTVHLFRDSRQNFDSDDPLQSPALKIL